MKHHDQANWNGIALIIKNVGARNKPARLRVDGVQYVTEGEAMLAQLLIKLGIPFTPNVSFQVEFPRRSGEHREFVPDFILDRKAYIWCGPHGEMLIHGFEAKGVGSTPSLRQSSKKAFRRARKKIQLLKEQRGIVVKLISDGEIKHYFEKGTLPIRPYEPEPDP